MVSFSKTDNTADEEKFQLPVANSIASDTVAKLPHPPILPHNSVSDFVPKSRCNELEKEQNPFEQQFGGGGGPAKFNPAKTPGGTSLLPSIQALQSGSLPGFSLGSDGLRTGPLSPNMLTGPRDPSDGDYFSADHNPLNDGARGFTPNESALRHESRILPSPSNLSPGPGGLYLGIPLGSPGFGAGLLQTPGSIEFQRTASDIREREKAKREMNITSQPQPLQMNEDNNNSIADYPEDGYSAAHSLHMLANTASASPRDSSPHYNIALGQPRVQPSTQKQILNRNQQILNQQMNQPQMNPLQANGQMAGRSNNPPIINGHSLDSRTRNNSINSNSSSPVSNGNSIGYDNEMNGHGAQAMGKKKAPTKRKASATKTPPKNNKRTKGNNNGQKREDDTKQEEFTNEDLDQMDDQGDYGENEENNDSGKPKKPETDDEKRKSFLERNRVAALKCRQRKKQWLNNLQAKVDTYSNENEMLQGKVHQLSHEIYQLKTMLLAHKDTPLGIQQNLASLTSMPQAGIYDDQVQMQHVQNPYGMAAMHPGQNPAMQ